MLKDSSVVSKSDETNYLDHLDVPNALEQAGQLRAVDAEREIPHEELEVGGEGAPLVFAQEAPLLPLLLVDIGGHEDAAEEAGGHGGPGSNVEGPQQGGSGEGLEVEVEGEGRDRSGPEGGEADGRGGE